MVKVKICGITNYEDALWATNLGADYIGFNFYKNSKRKVTTENAANIISKLPPFVQKVWVGVNEPIENIEKTLKKIPFEIIQLHGDEKPEYIRELKERFPQVKIMKAFRIADEKDLEEIPNYKELVDFILLDSKSEEELGGTGKSFDWKLAKKAKKFEIPIFLAGGLNAENVKKAIKTVAPYCVDVASGVERTPRRKDFNKMMNFISIVKKIS